MKSYNWKENETAECHYYYREEDGRIVGQTNKISHTKIWLSKIMLISNEEQYLGQYIDLHHSKKAIEQFWLIQERTLIEQS